ncbi:Transcription elongation factor SPT6 [Armadillidium nasatum]|uniref:Transcription elongation factor SPT6 n=1 Tax=Armadillidium nasatum TaxID=96803 RepID=A0A5N5SVR3_9CRUS|nr:Transcription elongation factor SPT6 [Armadillidium nasatum]
MDICSRISQTIHFQSARKEAHFKSARDLKTIQRIYNSLDLIRNSTCEVPFIAFYRKEEVHPLTIHDLWKIYKFDEKWCQLKGRKSNFSSLYKKMVEYQTATIMKDMDAPLPEDVRIIKEEDVTKIDSIESYEEFNDFYKHFLLYYGKDQESMKEYFKAKTKKNKIKRIVTKTIKVMRKVKRKKKKKANIGDEDGEESEKEKNDDAEDEEEEEEEEEEAEEEVETEVETEEEVEVEEEGEIDEAENLKKPIRRHEYELLKKAGIVGFVKKFGLTPEQFGEHVRDRYPRYEVEQFPEDPIKEAENYVSKMCSTPERVMEAAVRMVGWQLSCEPLVRKSLREEYFEKSCITIRPTPKGVKTIDEHHYLYSMKYLSDKPVCELQGDQFLKIKAGVEEKVITFSLSDSFKGLNNPNFLDDMKQYYNIDEFSQVVQDWNELRGRSVEFAYNRVLADLKRELSQRLLTEAKEHVLEKSCSKLYNWLKVAPYYPGDFADEDEDDWDTSKGFRVFSIAYVPDRSQAAFGCCVDIEGECSEIIRMEHLLEKAKCL